jgi:hypothetical protein
MIFDPARLAAILPRPLSFSPDGARHLAMSAAAVLDVVGLRAGRDLGDLAAPLFGGGGTPALPETGAPGRQPTPPELARDLLATEPAREVINRAADDAVGRAGVADLRSGLAELTKKLAASEKKNRELETRLKRLES